MVFDRRRQLVEVHIERAVPRDDQTNVPAREMRAYRRTRSEAHCAQSSAGQETAGRINLRVVRRPFLMQPYVRGHGYVAPHGAGQGAYYARAPVFFRDVGQGGVDPLRLFLFSKLRDEHIQRFRRVAHDCVRSVQIFVDFRAVGVELQQRNSAAAYAVERAEPAVEARSHRDEEVAL